MAVELLEKVDQKLDQLTHPLLFAGARTGIKVAIRPWWGSRRAHNHRVHTFCGEEVWLRWDLRTDRLEPYCRTCECHIPDSEVEVAVVPHTWLCPRVKYPQVQNGVVVVWEGECGIKSHNHCQTIEVLDLTDTALLIQLTAGAAGRNFLIGIDDEHPFATQIIRSITTVQDAFNWLVPNLVREAYILGKEVKRQGDWFFIPETREVKEAKFWREWDLAVPGSHPLLKFRKLYHNVPLIYSGVQTRHIGEMVLYRGLKNTSYGAPRVKGEVSAPDHPALMLTSWHIGVRRRSGPGPGDESSNRGLD